MEELWSKGEAGLDLDSFSQSPIVLEPDHFQSLFLIMGFLYSLGLIVLLWDILANPNMKFLYLMLSGLSACLLITFANLFLFSTVLWTPITVDTLETTYYDSLTRSNKIAKSAKTIRTGDFEFNMEILVNNKTIAFVILGYGLVTSFIFIFMAMMRSLGNSFLVDNRHFVIELIQA